jgi:hypothetical protein
MSDPARLDDVFPVAAGIALELLRRPEVAARWTAPSVLDRMSVGGLAVHLGRQAVRAAELVGRDAGDLPVLASADEHYHRSSWVTAPADDPVNDRSADEDDAAAGPAALAARVDLAVAEVHRELGDGRAHDVVPVPWAGWALRRDDFLLTRLLEVVVHSDDLARSAGVPTPEFPEAVFGPVRDLLVRLAVHRHGQSAVVSALTRRERAQPVTAF